MNHSNLKSPRPAARRQRGFTLVELMVATTLAVFLLGGLFATVQSTRRVYGSQNLLAQLQDNERLATTLMADVIESSGYFPDPIHNTAAGEFVTDTLFPPPPAATPGQAIIGGANTAGPGDMITVSYAAAPNDNVFNCIGNQNLLPTTALFENTFRVNNNNELVCTFNGTDYELVTSNTTAGATTLGLKTMTIQYGIQAAGPGDTGSCTNTYQTTAQMVATPANWNLVCSVSVTLTFFNPLQTNPLKPNYTISITRVIAIMQTAGVNS
jgi:type IV pilus assembly protein PilW